MKNIIGMLIVLTSISLTACGGGGGGSHTTEVVYVAPEVVNYTPDLIRFDIFDSYGVDTATSDEALRISASSIFNVDWKVNSLEDYRVNIRINDSAGIANSIRVYSEICGSGRACDQSSGVVCEYTSDHFLSCNNSVPEDIIELFPYGAPENLYLILEICDIDSPSPTLYCTYDSYPVRMEQ